MGADGGYKCLIPEQGLGPVAWWTGETEDAGDADAEGEGDAMEEG